MGNPISRHDHPNFTTTQINFISRAQMGVSAVPTTIFRSRNKAVCNYAHVRIASAASAPAGSLCVAKIRNYPSNTSLSTIGVVTYVSATSAGSAFEVTMTTNCTLTSIKDVVALVWTGGGDKGKIDVCLEWQFLPGFTALK